jgi:Leucine-rich repeat (LRR) protein
MNDLVTLNASGTPVKSLKPLSGLQKLENLFVNNTNVKSLSPVENITSLKQLKVYNTKVKPREIEKLQQKRMDLNIIYY